jgi:hypothetical protein
MIPNKKRAFFLTFGTFMTRRAASRTIPRANRVFIRYLPGMQSIAYPGPDELVNAGNNESA